MLEASVMMVMLQRSVTGCISSLFMLMMMMMLGFYWTSWTVPI